MNSKLWYQSKTVWLNIISILVYLVTSLSSNTIFSAATLGVFGTVLGVLNLILRIFFTGEPIATGSTTVTANNDQLLKS